MPAPILVLNPGSTSTKIALFSDGEELVNETLGHSSEELAGYGSIPDQAPMRRKAIDEFLDAHRAVIGDSGLLAVVARGGLLKPVKGGVYAVNEAMVADLRSGRYGSHASNLGAVLALDLAQVHRCPAFIADPVVVDELHDVARLSGIPRIPRRSIFHALNQKSAAREICSRLGRAYEETNLIVAHMGGGISVGAHERGRVVDVNNALDGEGPFSPERAGTVPAGQLAELVAGGELTLAEVKRLLTGGGGLVAYLGTNSVQELLERARNSAEADLVLRAMCYQIAKEIAAHGATLRGRVDAIVLTGGIAHNEEIVARIRERVAFLAPVHVVPGEREMVSLAAAAAGALDGSREILTYE
jgi:butyrate kinase